ncbi:MAG: DNA polymerase IV [Bacteroidetes bacterium]|nr:DNA polymerase IV [Bacteroidota bacterium]MDA0929779.1 DNA polymerase IV [Bacteroidota bacterium]
MANDSLVLHIDMDSFFVSVEQRRDARLKNRAVIIAGHSARSVVASCSYESRALGIRSGMPLSVARRLCPEALILRGDMELYSQTSAEITEMLNQHLPCLEKASIDEFYADLSGMERFFGGLSYARELREKMLEELGLPVSFGISVNKTVSKIATGQAKPNGSKAVAAGQERRFLSPLPVRSIPMAGPVITSKLEHMGIVQIESLQQIPLSWMGQAFGKPGIEIGQKARGIDNLPVTPYREQKSMSAETTFDQDLADPRELRRHLIALTERLGQELRSQNRMCSEISVKLRYSDFQTFSKQRKIPYTCSDQQLIDHACDLMSALFVRRSRVRCIGLRLSGWITGQTTLSLFDEPSPQIHLYQTMDKLRERFGTHSILRASSLGLNNPKQSPND